MSKLILLLTMTLFTILTVQFSFAADTVPPENLANLIASALADNPELKSSQSRWQMFVNKSRQTGALDDPMFMFKLQNMVVRNPTSFDKDPQTAKVIGISQQLPFWGKRALKQEVAQHESESYKWEIGRAHV